MPSTTTRPRFFLSFAEGDGVQARLTGVELLASTGITVDQSFTSGPFATMRGDIIRSSLYMRLRRCTGLLCLYSSATLDDPWASWVLEAAVDLDLPVLGIQIPGRPAGETEDLLIELGATLLPPSRTALVAQARELAERREGSDAAAPRPALRTARFAFR